MPSTKVQVDSTAAMAIASAEGLNARNKKMDVRLHHIRAMLKDQVLFLDHVQSEEQVADILTKPLGLPAFERLSVEVVSRFL